MDWALSLLQKRGQSGVLNRDKKLLRESFEETLEDPDGQIDSALPTSLEVIPTDRKPRKNKEIL